jgi:hypothetical protein
LAGNLNVGGKLECWREDYLGYFRFSTSGDAISGDATSGYFNKSIKENSLRSWVLIPEDNRHSTVTRKIPLFSVEPVTIFYTHCWVHWFLPLNIACTGTFFIIFIFSLKI